MRKEMRKLFLLICVFGLLSFGTSCLTVNNPLDKNDENIQEEVNKNTTNKNQEKQGEEEGDKNGDEVIGVPKVNLEYTFNHQELESFYEIFKLNNQRRFMIPNVENELFNYFDYTFTSSPVSLTDCQNKRYDIYFPSSKLYFDFSSTGPDSTFISKEVGIKGILYDISEFEFTDYLVEIKEIQGIGTYKISTYDIIVDGNVVGNFELKTMFGNTDDIFNVVKKMFSK